MKAVWSAIAGILSSGAHHRAEAGPVPSWERGGQGAPSVPSPATRRLRFIQRIVDRFERRHRASLLASLALHFIALLMVKWFAFPPQPVKPLLVEVELLAPELGTRQKTLVAKAKTPTVIRQARRPREKEPEFPQPREDMTAQLEKAPSPGAGGQPAGKAKAGAGRGVPPPTVALPKLAEAKPEQAEAPSAAQESKPEPLRPAASPWQQAAAGSTMAPRIASPGQTASTRVQAQPRSGVESARGPTFLASQSSAAQSLPPEYRHSARPGGTVSSIGGAARSAMGNAARDDTHENTWQTASTGAQSAAATAGKAASPGARTAGQTFAARSPAPAGESPAALYAATPAPGATVAKADRSVSAAGGASDRNLAGGRSTAAEARSGFAVAAAGSSSRVMTGRPGGESSATATASGGGTAETRSGFAVAAAGVSSRAATGRPGGEGSTVSGAVGGGTSETRSGFATAAAGGSARQSGGQAGGEGSTSGRGIGSAPGEGSAPLQASGSGGGISAAKGVGGSDLSERSGAGRGRGLEEGAGGTARLIAAADRAGSLGAFGPGTPAMAAGPEQAGASLSTDEAPGTVLQQVAARAEAQVMEERYEVGQLKSASPSTLCHLPLMLAGLGGTPIPKGLDNISMSAAAMDVEEPPRHQPGNRMPEYPFDGLVRQLEGRVVVRAQVLTNGRIGEVLVKIPSGSPILDRSALAAVKSWRFLPARRNGQPVTAWLDVPIQYSNPMKYR